MVLSINPFFPGQLFPADHQAGGKLKKWMRPNKGNFDLGLFLKLITPKKKKKRNPLREHRPLFLPLWLRTGWGNLRKPSCRCEKGCEFFPPVSSLSLSISLTHTLARTLAHTPSHTRTQTHSRTLSLPPFATFRLDSSWQILSSFVADSLSTFKIYFRRSHWVSLSTS